MIRNNSTTQFQAVQLVKANLEMILPCNEMQQAFYLLNQQSESDPGVIVAEAELSGELDRKLFVDCWNLELARHESLRMSVRPKKDNTPMLVIWKKLFQEIEFVDGEKGIGLEQIKLELASNVRIDAPPVSKLILVQRSPNFHQLFWGFHHLFLDGWSTSIVLRDVVNRYAARNLGESDFRGPTKPTYVQFHRSREQMDYWSAREHWGRELEGYQGCPALPKNRNGFRAGDSASYDCTLTDSASIRLSDWIRKGGLTSGVVATGAWSLVMHDLFNKNDVGFGMTVSGRNIALEGIHNFVGMLASVVPFRSKLDTKTLDSSSPVDWLQAIRDSQFRSRQHEHLPLSQIYDLCESRPGSSLFESLLVVENFPQDDRKDRPLQINRFSSGAASGFPITCFVIPGPTWSIRVDVDNEVVDSEGLASRLANSVSAILSALPDAHVLQEVTSGLRRSEFKELSATGSRQDRGLALGVEFTPTEIRLAEIWETMLGAVQVLPDDDFFALGGKSLTAVRVCNAIKIQFGIEVAPSTLVECPTIRQLAKKIVEGESKVSEVLRFNQVDSQDILICCHYGVGYASYFRHLAREFGNCGVVGVQSKGMSNGDAATSFEELAEYLSQTLDPLVSGKKIHIAGYCMSAKFSLALANELKDRGHQVSNVMVIDSGPDFPTQPQTLKEFIRRTKSPVWALCRYAKRKSIYLRMWFRFLLAKMSNDTEFMAFYYGELVRRKSIQAFLEYDMQPTQFPFSLIRSSEYSDLPEKDFHLEWRNWAEDFRFCIVEGDHKLLLLEPAVKRLAQVIDGIISGTRYSDNSTIWRN